MTKLFLAFGAVAVALSAAPAEARHHGRAMTCAKWRHGHCVRWVNHGYMRSMRAHQAAAARRAAYRVGYRFGPSYAYVPVTTLPQPVVTQYSLSPDYRYVYRDNYVYVVDPKTYAITRVIDALTH